MRAGRAEMADGFVEDQAPMPGDGEHRARQLAGFDLGVQRRDDAAEPGGGHADRFGCRVHEGSGSGFRGAGVGQGGPPPGALLAFMPEYQKGPCRTVGAGSIPRAT